MIEQLLGIVQLSEKADILKELTKNTKDKIQQETFRISAVEEANERINKSITDLQRRQRVWGTNKEDKIKQLKSELLALEHIDIEQELKAHAGFEDFNSKKGQTDTLNAEIARLTSAIDREQKLPNKAQKDLNTTLEHKCYACGQELHDEKHALL